MRCCYCNKDLPASDFGSRPESASGKRYYCKACGTNKSVSWRWRKSDEGRCYSCGKRKPTRSKKRCSPCIKAAKDQYASRTDARRLLQNTRNREIARLLKDEVYAAYGGYTCACVPCGEKHKEFLTLDHIKGDGKKHREVVGNGGRGSVLYRWLKKHNFPPGFRILCMNCNFALGHSGYCPHAPGIKVPLPKKPYSEK